MGIYLRRAVLNKLQLRGRRRSIFPAVSSLPFPSTAALVPPCPPFPRPGRLRVIGRLTCLPVYYAASYGAVFGIVPASTSIRREPAVVSGIINECCAEEGESEREEDRERDKSPFPISSDPRVRPVLHAANILATIFRCINILNTHLMKLRGSAGCHEPLDKFKKFVFARRNRSIRGY